MGDNRVGATRLEQRLRSLTARRIAIIKPSALGDVVQTLPLLPALRKRFPGSWITWVIQRELSDLVSEHPDLDDVLTVDRRPRWSAARRFLGELRRQRFDLVLDLQGLLRTAVMTWATGAPWRIGLETAREGARFAANLIIPGTGKLVPAHARYWRVAEALGVGNVERRTLVQVSTQDRHEAERWLCGLPRPIFAVQWGARWETKRWPLERMVEVLAQAGQTWGGSVIFIGGPGEQSMCDAAATTLSIRAPSLTARNLAGRTTLKQLAALLASVDAVVSNDSGPLHLAAELGTPVLGIFTCTSPVRSGPSGDQHELVSTTLPCAASYHKQCPHAGPQHLACHAELTAARVWQGLVRLVERNRLIESSRRRAA
jgi:heptosyltransferase-1